jgi:nitroreductase
MITSAIEAIKLRTSVRSYRDRELEPAALQALRDLCQEPRSGPFGNAVRFSLISLDEAGKAEVKQLGTYGVIKGASWYIAASVAAAPGAMEDFGCCFEDAVIRCTQMGLGTCWLGGSFNRAGFARTIGLREHEVLPCVTPAGYPAEKRSLVDSAMRLMAGSNNRKPWGELFFENDFSHPMAGDPAGPLTTVLRCVRAAPSASNKQPWRVVLRDGNIHLYLSRTKGYGRWFPGVDLQRIDIGIAMSHLALAARELGLPGGWRQLTPAIDPGGREYIASWQT